MSFVEAVRSGFKKYATFSGRARRSEYWYWALFQSLVMLPFTIIFVVTYAVTLVSILEAADSSGNVVGSQVNWVPVVIGLVILLVASLALALPSYAVMTRRLHDMGQPGWWVLLNFIGFGIVPFVMAFFDSQAGTNEWGEDPKAGERPQAPPGYAVPSYLNQPPAPPAPPVPPA